MDTLTQVERLIELAIIQRSELRRLVEELPQLKTHLSEEIERTFEETEPQLRAELEEWTTKQTADKTAALGVALEAKIADLAKSLEVSTQARYNAIIAERAENARLAAQAEAKIAEHAASLPGAVKEIVSAELARFPRAGEIDQLRKEFAEPKSLNPRGKWVVGETYNKLDLVTINGDSYVSNIDGNTEKPSRSAANWTLNAARGNSGGGGGITALNDLLGNPSAGDIVGSEGNNYVRKTLTAGTGITITDDPSTITIDASGAQEMLTATVKNAESVAITRGQVVYLFSATGGFPSVKLAYNTSDATSAKTFGVVSDVSIAPNGTGTITCVGVVSNLNLGAYNDGDTVYLGATPGSFTATKPYAPNHLVYVGIIERANAGNGELYVRIQNGYEIDEIHDVQINNPRQAGQTLIYDATNALWKNARLTAGVGVSILNADSSITISADGGVNYQGTWNASTNTPTLTSSVGTKGFYYVVSVAGSTNLNGVTDWKVGDWAIFNGTAWEKVDTTDQVSSVFGRTGAVVGVSTDYSSVGITNTAIGASNPSTGAFTTLSASTSLTSPDVTLGTSGPSVKSTLSARAPRQGLVYNGTTNSSATLASTIGTSDFTFSVPLTVPTSNPSGPRGIFSIGNFGTSQSFQVYLGTGGELNIVIFGASGGDYRASNVNGFVSANAGKTGLLTITRSSTTLTVYFNGVSQTLVAPTISGVDPTWAGTLTSTTVQHGNMSNVTWFYVGYVGKLDIYNRALSASEVVALYEAGAPAGADYNNATNTAFTNGTFANVGYSTFSGASATGFVATYGGGGEAAATSQIANLSVAPGRKYLIKFDLTLTSGTAPYVGLAQFGVQWLTGSAAVTTGQVRAAAGANSIVVTIRSVNATFATNAGVGFASQEASSFTVSNLTATPLGLLLAPDAAQAGGGLVWYDTSGNAANITLPASGVSWNVPSSSYWGGNLKLNGTVYSRQDSAGGTTYNLIADNGAGGAGVNIAAIAFQNGATQKASIRAAVYGNGYMAFHANDDTEKARLTAGGTLLLKTDGIDSSNGKLQLATHTTSAGGIGFGTDTSLYRGASGIGTLELSASSGTVSIFKVALAGTAKAQFGIAAGATYIDYDGSLIVRNGIGGTTALTLDSSQNATFAGSKITLAGSGNGEVDIRRATNSNGSSVAYRTTSTLKWYHGLRGLVNDNWYLQNEVAGNTALFFDAATSNATFAGNLTVNGTGTSSVAGVLQVGPLSPINQLDVSKSGTTNRISVQVDTGNNGVHFIDSGGTRYTIGSSIGLYAPGDYFAFNRYSGSAWTEMGRFNSNGNFLLGKITDGGQKLQVNGRIAAADATGSAIIAANQAGATFTSNSAALEASADNPNTGANNRAFGTYRTGDTAYRLLVTMDGSLAWGPGNASNDWLLERVNTTNMRLGVTSGANIFGLASGGSRKGYLYWDTTNFQVGTDSGNLILDSAGGNVVVASTRALQLGNQYQAGAPTATGYVTIKDSAGNTYKVLVGT